MSPPSGVMGTFVEGLGIFHHVLKICRGVVLTVQTFYKAKHNTLLILNIDKNQN